MTLEAWVKPTVARRLEHGRAQGAHRLLRRGALREHGHAAAVGARVHAAPTTSCAGRAKLPVGAWSHLAATYNGSTLALWVNGTQVASAGGDRHDRQRRPAPLRIGGNAIWGEWFNGLIDEVRVYNRR